MKRSLTISAAMLGAALALPAVAQQKPMNESPSAQPSTSTTMPSSSAASTQQPGFLQNQSSNEWRASKLIGASVYGPDNSSIGEIDDLIVASNGQLKAAVIGVGGFLGVGQKDVAVPIDALNVQRKANSSSIDKITVSFTKDQLKNAPKFAYYSAPSSAPATTTGAGTAPRPTGTPMSPPAHK
jgi:hypothetical protein